jgi:hypothetical protein
MDKTTGDRLNDKAVTPLQIKLSREREDKETEEMDKEDIQDPKRGTDGRAMETG